MGGKGQYRTVFRRLDGSLTSILTTSKGNMSITAIFC
jgi:hypothetical protein